MEIDIDVSELRMVNGSIGIPVRTASGKLTGVTGMGPCDPHEYLYAMKMHELEEIEVVSHAGKFTIRKLTPREELAFEQEILNVNYILANKEDIIDATLIKNGGHF